MKHLFFVITMLASSACLADDGRYVLPEPVQEGLSRKLIASLKKKNLPREAIQCATPLAAWRAAFGFVSKLQHPSARVINGAWDVLYYSHHVSDVSQEEKTAMRNFIDRISRGKIKVLQAHERTLLVACGHVWFVQQAKL